MARANDHLAALQMITLLHSRLDTQQGGGSAVEIPQGALAAVMSLNGFPQDIPQWRVGGARLRVGSQGQNYMSALKEHVHQMIRLSL